MTRPVHRHLSVLVSLVLVLAAVGGTMWLLGGADPPDTVLSSEDRAALGGPDVDRGDEPAAVGYAVPSEPDAVARAYLVAAYGAAPGDAGRTRRDAVRYAEPGSPPAVVGVPVLDAPAPGARRVAVVEGLTPSAAAPDGTRRAYLASVATSTGAPGESVRTARLRTQIVVHRQPDGRWLVVAETPDTADTPALPAGDG
ncbi:hypothetical protein EV383_0578 [Pseudonocardia sediminis]|uniref:Mce-associated membrane protein n=1 Tax=Pseudonocardia sediminis TaxID=1397368 RepID=A0A4V6ME91_PSEST|nr:hypothetical protein [Pseudonocardia sediminis]RZT83760.1 hypothetical protein EV383_0578 [Pseudonocardia sediminis]